MSEYLALSHNSDVYLMVHASIDAGGVQLGVRGSSLGEAPYDVVDPHPVTGVGRPGEFVGDDQAAHTGTQVSARGFDD